MMSWLMWGKMTFACALDWSKGSARCTGVVLQCLGACPWASMERMTLKKPVRMTVGVNTCLRGVGRGTVSHTSRMHMHIRLTQCQMVYPRQTPFSSPTHTRVRLRCLAKQSRGMVGMAWHGLLGCDCALSSLYHSAGHLPQKVSYLHPSNLLYTYVLRRE